MKNNYNVTKEYEKHFKIKCLSVDKFSIRNSELN